MTVHSDCHVCSTPVSEPSCHPSPSKESRRVTKQPILASFMSFHYAMKPSITSLVAHVRIPITTAIPMQFSQGSDLTIDNIAV